METASSEDDAASTGKNEKLKVTGAIVIYVVAISAMPIWNKVIFSGNHKSLKFPYPIATAFLQLGCISLTLGLANIVGHYIGNRNDSWILGPHFAYKVRNIAPIGLLFGAKYGFTNWGLQLIPTGQHLLLASTDIFWTVLSAWLVNGEPLGILKQAVVVLMTAGSVMVGIQAGQTLDAPVLGLIVNLTTPFSMALCISVLRKNTVELFRYENPISGTMSPIEFTSLKLLLSSAVAFVLALCLEGGHMQLPTGTTGPTRVVAWWEVIGENPERVAFVLLGAIWPLIFQVNLTWLAAMTSASTCGVLGGIRVLPQWMLNAVWTGHFDTSKLQLGGTLLVFAASVLYAGAAMRFPLNTPINDQHVGAAKMPFLQRQPTDEEPGLEDDTSGASSNNHQRYALFDPDGLPWVVRTGTNSATTDQYASRKLQRRTTTPCSFPSADLHSPTGIGERAIKRSQSVRA